MNPLEPGYTPRHPAPLPEPGGRVERVAPAEETRPEPYRPTRRDPEEESPDRPEWIPLSSSDLAAVWYDRQTREMRLRFRHARLDGVDTYSYQGVSEVVYNMLLSAGSHGVYFHRNIKNQYAAVPLPGGGN